MNERIWDKFLTERDKAVFAAGGFGARAGFGKRPALRVIDVNWAFSDERPEPILESIRRWRTSCGEESWVALQYIKQLIEAARAKGLPVIYTTGGLCAKIALSQSSRSVFVQASTSALKPILVESRTMRSAASGYPCLP